MHGQIYTYYGLTKDQISALYDWADAIGWQNDGSDNDLLRLRNKFVRRSGGRLPSGKIDLTGGNNYGS